MLPKELSPVRVFLREEYLSASFSLPIAVPSTFVPYRVPEWLETKQLNSTEVLRRYQCPSTGLLTGRTCAYASGECFFSYNTILQRIAILSELSRNSCQLARIHRVKLYWPRSIR